ncbi:MAG TPA: tetratricopeptide repeat protein [Desulfatiglandales bacterium]|nr:tetratricopeptide repeat protein [Desulfatiglandales bacterium]
MFQPSTQYKNRILPLLVLCVLITASYLPTFSGEFILDDRPLVKDNLFIREFSRPAHYLSHEDGVSDQSLSGYHTGYYRPLVNLFYAIDYKIWGMRPSGFRATNLILHLLTCIMLYQFLRKMLGKSFIPFSVTLLFGLHPVNTASVAWISSRNNILVTLFSLISFYYYLKNSEEKKIWAQFLSYLSFVAALFCKEFAVMLLPIFFLYNRLMVHNKKICKDEIFGYLPFIFILFFYFIIRVNVTGSALTPISTPNVWKNLYFIPLLIIYNLKLILVPYSLHSFIIQYPDNYLSWKAFTGFICLGFLAFFLWRERKNKILLFSFVAFLVALFPVLNILNTSAVTKISMRWLYFPMIFLSFSCLWYLGKLIKVNRLVVMSGFSAVIIYFGTYSYLLNQNLWHDENTFFTQEILHFNNTFYIGGFAESLLDEGNIREAEKYFQIAIKKYPRDANNYINYSALLIDTSRPDDALSYLDKAKPLAMTHNERGEWFNNMGMAYFQLKEQDKALEHFLKAVHFNPKEHQFWANLGGAYGSVGDYENSVSALRKGLDISEDSIQLRKNLAVTYMKMEDYEKAVITLEEIPDPEMRKNRDIQGLLRKARNKLLSKDY